MGKAGLKNLCGSAALSENERLIAAYVLEHPEAVARLSSRELARRTLTSGSAVLRFVRKLGFESYKEFQLNVVDDFKSADLAGTVIAAGEHAITAMNKIAALECQSVEETKRKLSSEVVEAIAERIHQAPYVDFFAKDALATICTYASHNLTLTGRIANVYQDKDRMVILAMQMPADHTAFLVSRSGTDKTLLVAARALKERGVAVVVVTSVPNSPLAALADHVLLGFYSPAFQDFGDVVFGASMKYLFDVLFVMAFSKDVDCVLSLNESYDRLYYAELDSAR